MKKKVITTDLIVSLASIPALKRMSFPKKATLSLGPMITIADIAGSQLIMDNFPVLSKAAVKLGSPQVRNRATIGGNICTARPAGDMIGPLIAYGATVRVAGVGGERIEPVEAVIRGPGQTTIRSNEILTSITLNKPVKNTGGSYIKYTIRNAMEIALVSVTTLVSFEGDVCRSARVVLGAVAPTFVRCPAAEEYLVGKRISEDVAEKAGLLVVDACRPISDVRASADYRRRLVQVLTKRSLLESTASITN
jgi:carbon-monoxide dehydrogenase medium subunit